jgi:hypothetical protein
MVALLISMAIGAIWMTALVPTWRQQAIREKEADLVFRGEQYARAIVLYQMKNEGRLPTSIEELLSQKHLRKKYKDPITGQDFGLVVGGMLVSGTPGQAPIGTTPGSPQQQQQQQQGGQQPATGAGISGVRSLSNATSIRVYYNQQVYNMWQFDAAGARGRMGLPPAGQGNQPGRGQPGRGGPGAQPGRDGQPPRGGQPGIGTDRPGRVGAPPPGRAGAPGRGRGNTP